MTVQNESPDGVGRHRQRLEQCLRRIDQHDETLNVMMEVTADSARRDADRADALEQRGESCGPLHGVIVALKDNIDTAQIRTTSGSRLYEEYTPQHDATVWSRMRQAGAILIGKVGLHECVFGPTSQNVWFGRIRNPWNPEHIPGGSSGGSGAAIAAQYCDLALGTDTGGSVRIPSAMCGITGLRPTQGAVSNLNVRPISPHLDTVGPMARSVADVAQAFSVMQAYDPQDETSRRAPTPTTSSTDAPPNEPLSADLSGLRIGIATGFFDKNLDSAVQSAYVDSQRVFADAGAKIVEIDIPDAERATQVTPRIIVADAADYYHDAIRHRSDAIGEEVMKRMKLGFDVTGVEYANHMRFMLHWRRRVAQLFEDQVDVILTPTIGIPAPTTEESDDLLSLVGRITPFTMAWALAGVPTLALPAGFSDSGLPVSIQLAAPEFEEQRLFRAGHGFQSLTTHHEQTPPMLADDGP